MKLKMLNILCGFFLINTIAGLGYGVICPKSQLMRVMVFTMFSACVTQFVWCQLRGQLENK